MQPSASKLAVILFAAVWVAFDSNAAMVTADALVRQSEVYLGETIPFQIQVSGSDQPQPPDVSSITDFSVQPLGGQTFSNESVNLVNGRMNRVASRGHTFNYQLTPKHAGQLKIPSISVNADGRWVRTRPVTLTARPPTEREDFKLRLGLSKTNGYVGEPITLEVVWFLGQEIQGGRFALPVSEAFRVSDPYVNAPTPGKTVEVYVDDKAVQAQEGRATLNGRNYTSLRFQKILVPKREGIIVIEPATVAFGVPAAEPNAGGPRRGSFPGNHFAPALMGFPGFGSFRQVIIPSNPLRLEVKPLPTYGRPPSFAGPVGRYEISATANPTDLNMGDPITLTVKLAGSPGLDHVKLPPLGNEPALTNDFKIPSDTPSEQRAGPCKLFTLTVRPLHSGVKEIPPIELSYFDTASGSYQVARSKPIPVRVRLAKVVTAADGEGLALPSPTAAPVTTKLEEIVHTNGDREARQDQLIRLAVWLRSPFLLFLIAMLPTGYLVFRLVRFVRHWRYANRELIRARRAYGRLTRTLPKISLEDPGAASDSVLKAMKIYLADRLGLNAGVLTFIDVREPLAKKGVPAETLNTLRDFFQACESRRFADSSDSPDVGALIGQCQQVSGQTEGILRNG